MEIKVGCEGEKIFFNNGLCSFAIHFHKGVPNCIIGRDLTVSTSKGEVGCDYRIVNGVDLVNFLRVSTWVSETHGFDDIIKLFARVGITLEKYLVF